jgi:hypothetical protein
MPEIKDDSRLAQIHLSADEVDELVSGETLTVECPHTGETIYLDRDRDGPRCECCGQKIADDDAITPSIGRGNLERLRKGGTLVFDSAHTDDDVTIILRMKWEDAENGWL